jgi:hypothetical protein
MKIGISKPRIRINAENKCISNRIELKQKQKPGSGIPSKPTKTTRKSLLRNGRQIQISANRERQTFPTVQKYLYIIIKIKTVRSINC